MVEIEKPDIETIEGVYSLIAYLKSVDCNFITPEGRAFIDGIHSVGEMPKLVSKKVYDDLFDMLSDTEDKLYDCREKMYDHEHTITKLKNKLQKKRWWQ